MMSKFQTMMTLRER